MPIAFQCPGCGKGYRLADHLAGKKVKCGCGVAVVLPKTKPAAQIPPAADDLQPLSGIDSSLWNDALPPLDGGPGGGGLPDWGLGVLPAMPVQGAAAPLSYVQPATAVPAPQQKVRQGNRNLKPTLIVAGCVAAGLAAVVLMIVAIVSLSRPGFESPEDVFAAYQNSLEKKNWQTLFDTLDPDSQARMTEVAVMLTLARAQESTIIRQVLSEHSGQAVDLPEAIGGGLDSQEDFEKASAHLQDLRQRLEVEQKSIVSGIRDRPAFFAALAIAVEADQAEKMPRNPLLKSLMKKPAGEFRRLLASAQMTDLQVDGDKARGIIPLVIAEEKIDAPIEFARHSGRWYLHASDTEEFISNPVGETFCLPLGVSF